MTRISHGMMLAAMVTMLPSIGLAQHPAHCEEHGVQPLLSVGDFNGDGVVSRDDLRIIIRQMQSKDDTPFFDLNADGKVNGRDVAATANSQGARSTPLDRQMAALFWATEKYRNIENAIADGYRPFTQMLRGHGIHLTRLPFLATPTGLDPNHQNILDNNLSITQPEGLNYDENGKLVAVFYYHGTDVKNWVFANQANDQAAISAAFVEAVTESSISAATGGHYPRLFASHDALWHQHWGGCWDGLDYVQMAFDPTIVPQFNQHMFPSECAAQGEISGKRQGWIPAFNMLHVWLYQLNPCGTFAGTHPHVSEDSPEEPIARPLEHWFDVMGIPNPYPDGGGGHH